MLSALFKVTYAKHKSSSQFPIKNYCTIEHYWASSTMRLSFSTMDTRLNRWLLQFCAAAIDSLPSELTHMFSIQLLLLSLAFGQKKKASPA